MQASRKRWHRTPHTLTLLFRYLFLFFLFVAALPNARAEVLPVEAFARLPALSDIALSPSGDHAAFMANFDGNTMIVAQSVTTGKHIPITKTDNKKYVFRWMKWVNDDTLIFSIYYPDSRQGVRTGETRLFSASLENPKPKILGQPRSYSTRERHYSQFQDNVISLLPGEPNHILLQLDLEKMTFPGVHKVHVKSGRRSRIQKGREPIRSWVADQQGNVRAGQGFDQDEAEHSLWVRRTSSNSLIKVATWRTFDADAIIPMGFAVEPALLYVRARHEGRQAIFLMDLDSENFDRELVVSDPNFDIDGELKHSNKTGEVIGVAHAHAPGGILYFDSSDAALQRSVDAALPNTFNRIISTSTDEMQYLVLASASNKPGTYYYGNRESSSLREFASQYPMLDRQPLSTKQRVYYTTRDGTNIEAYLSLPPNSSGENMPAIVLPHGGPMARDYAGFDYWTQFFTNRGYAVLQPNFRGSSGYGHEFLEHAVQGFGRVMQDDLEDATHWLIEEKIADESRICIAGSSYGGYAALMGAVKTPDLYRCAISFAPITDLIALRNNARFYVNRNVVREQIGTQTKALKETSPRYHVQKIQIPVLLAHGEFDRVVPVTHSRDMAKALKKAKKNFRYLELQNGGHNLALEKNRLAVFAGIDEFLAQYLPVN